MIKIIKRIIFFFALAVSVIIVREFLALYNDIRAIDEYWGYAFLVFISLILIYFVIIPVIKILSIPRIHPPVNELKDVDQLIEKRLNSYSKNKLIPLFNTALNNRERYDESVKILSAEVHKVRKIYVARLFYSTSISQNGFLDALFILSASINLIREIFVIYNGRASNVDLLRLLRKIYTAVAIGGSETIEYATDEILQSITADTVKSIPFIDKVAGSLADGFVNALLLTRISYITENYCTKLLINNDKDLLPSYRMVYETTKILTKDIKDKMLWSFIKRKKGEEIKAEDIIPGPDDYTLAAGGTGSIFTRIFGSLIRKK